MKILIGHDVSVSNWAFYTTGCHPFLYNAAIGIIDENGALVGAILFSGFNGSDIEIHIYGPGALKRNIVREIAAIALKVFRVNRMTIRTSQQNIARGCAKLGAVYEGHMRCIFGPGDEHAAQQYAFFKESLERIAGLKGKK